MDTSTGPSSKIVIGVDYGITGTSRVSQQAQYGMITFADNHT